jgi:hypothetical protein
MSGAEAEERVDSKITVDHFTFSMSGSFQVFSRNGRRVILCGGGATLI